jgi:hypothetical protein
MVVSNVQVPRSACSESATAVGEGVGVRVAVGKMIGAGVAVG